MRLLLALSLIPALGWAQVLHSESQGDVIYIDYPISCEAPCSSHGSRNAEGNVQLLNGTWVNPTLYQNYWMRTDMYYPAGVCRHWGMKYTVGVCCSSMDITVTKRPKE